ncbi:MAG: hypothetical protein ACRC1U_11100 [Vibrionaceae bacterium]
MYKPDPVKELYKKINAPLVENIERAKRRGITYRDIARLAGVSYEKVRVARAYVFPIADHEVTAINNAIRKLSQKR